MLSDVINPFQGLIQYCVCLGACTLSLIFKQSRRKWIFNSSITLASLINPDNLFYQFLEPFFPQFFYYLKIVCTLNGKKK